MQKLVTAVLLGSTFLAPASVRGDAKPWKQPDLGGHEHGALKLSVVFDGAKLHLTLTAPLDSLIGFERAPDTKAEKAAASKLLEQMRDASSLFEPLAAAKCVVDEVKLAAPALETGTVGSDGHAELVAEYTYKCGQPKKLELVKLPLIDAFAKVKRIDLWLASESDRRRSTLKRPARAVRIVP
jgi:hypothetical protein